MSPAKNKMQQKENKLSKIDRTVLDNFYKLVHTDQTVRLRASLSTYKILTAMKKNKPNAFNEHLNYCIERLVTGLASSRALARRGYATLLLEILKNHQVSTERLLSIAQQKFGNISNETTPDNLLGYFLLIIIIIDSGTYKRSKQNANLLEKIFKYLLQLVRIKSYFDYPVSKLLTTHYDLFHPYLLGNISPESLGTGIKITHTELLTLVLCNKKQPMREFTSLDSAAIANLSESLTSDRLQRRPLHPIWIEYSKLLIAHMPQQFESFYNKILSPTFFKPNHNELASMGLELVATLLESTDSVNVIKVLLSDYVIRLLILSQRSKKNSLNSHCVNFFKTLSSSFEKSLKHSGEDDNKNEENRQFCILNRLTSAPGSVAFDEDSRSSSINNLLNHCRPNVLIKYIDKLLAILTKKFPTEEGKRLHGACARQVSHILHRPQMTLSEQLETTQRMAKCLLVNSMFKNITSQKDKDVNFWASKQIPAFISHLDPSTRTALKSAYHSSLDHLTSACSTLQRIENYGQIVDFVDCLLKVMQVECNEENADLKDLWPAYYNSLCEHRKLVKKNLESKILYPISNLYLFYGLQILEHGLDCKVQLNELAQSSKEALKNDPNDGSWADVLTDQIIAILSATECNPWIRKLCVSVFGSLLPHISETSIDLICEALTTPSDGDDCDDKEEESDGLDTDDSGEESGDETSGEEAGEVEDEESDKDENEEDDKMSLDGESQNEDSTEEKSEHGDEKVDDEEEEEGDYLDDEQMMKLDSVLADMFRLNRIGGKTKRDPSFQLRLLDLVKKILAKKRNDAEVVKKILATIGPLASRTRKSPELRPISDKITKMIAKMPGKKALTKAPTSTDSNASD